MMHAVTTAESAGREASDWVVRLQSADFDAGDALVFDAWLMADPLHAGAYDRAISVWNEYGLAAAEISRQLGARQVRPAPASGLRRLFLAGGAAAAAAAVAVVALPQMAQGPATETYATARGEKRSFNLADGSRVDLNGGTRLSVTLARDGRRVTLDEGQAVFDVASDSRRPFTIALGDRQVRVVGTRFDVRRRDGALAVTVAEGIVEVSPAGAAVGRTYRLRQGQRLQHQQGQAGVELTTAEPAEVMGWRAGRMVYRAAPLSEVVADLNSQFQTTVRIDDPTLAAIPISGVLVMDDEQKVLNRLALLLPVRAIPSGGDIVLRRQQGAQR